MSQQDIISKLKAEEKYCKEKGIAHIALFGSFARGDETETSDIDLIYTRDTSNTLTLGHYQSLKTRLRKKLGRTIDLLAEHALHPVFAKEIFAEKILIF